MHCVDRTQNDLMLNLVVHKVSTRVEIVYWEQRVYLG